MDKQEDSPKQRNLWTSEKIFGILHREKISCFKRKRTANFESRKIKTYLEWSIQDHIFSNITNHFQRSFKIDLFPSRVNKKATRNYAFYKKPDSVGNDVFSFSWKFEFFYAFPHFHTSHTSHNEQAEGIIIISLCTNTTLVYNNLICTLSPESSLTHWPWVSRIFVFLLSLFIHRGLGTDQFVGTNIF